MIFSHASQKLKLATLMIVISVLMFSPVVSRAQVGEVPINSNPLFGWTSLLSKDVIKEYLLDVAGRIIAGGIIRNLSNQVVGWIQGGNGQNVGFVAKNGRGS